MNHTGRITLEEFDRVFEGIRTWGRWGSDDELGALNHRSGNDMVEAMSLVKAGISLSLAMPLSAEAGPTNPRPLLHYLVQQTAGTDDDEGLVDWSSDFIALEYHGDAHSHLDALSHCSYRGRLYNDHDPIGGSSMRGSHGSLNVIHDGIVTRAVLVDVPAARGVPWLEPGDCVTADDLSGAFSRQDVSPKPGDAVLIRVGHRERQRTLGSWDWTTSRAGLHPSAVEWLAEQGVVMLGSENDSEARPSYVEGLAWPIHVLSLNAVGLLMLDNLTLERARDACLDLGRWTFLLVVAPLRIPDGTGSPVSPLAVF